MPRSIGRLRPLAPSHLDRFSAVFIITIAESSFRHTQVTKHAVGFRHPPIGSPGLRSSLRLDGPAPTRLYRVPVARLASARLTLACAARAYFERPHPISASFFVAVRLGLVGASRTLVFRIVVSARDRRGDTPSHITAVVPTPVLLTWLELPKMAPLPS